jgi:enolase
MKQFIEITDVIGRQIMDSRGNLRLRWRFWSTTATPPMSAAPPCPRELQQDIFEACEFATKQEQNNLGKGVLTLLKT